MSDLSKDFILLANSIDSLKHIQIFSYHIFKEIALKSVALYDKILHKHNTASKPIDFDGLSDIANDIKNRSLSVEVDPRSSIWMAQCIIISNYFAREKYDEILKKLAMDDTFVLLMSELSVEFKCANDHNKYDIMTDYFFSRVDNISRAIQISAFLFFDNNLIEPQLIYQKDNFINEGVKFKDEIHNVFIEYMILRLQRELVNTRKQKFISFVNSDDFSNFNNDVIKKDFVSRYSSLSFILEIMTIYNNYEVCAPYILYSAKRLDAHRENMQQALPISFTVEACTRNDKSRSINKFLALAINVCRDLLKTCNFIVRYQSTLQVLEVLDECSTEYQNLERNPQGTSTTEKKIVEVDRGLVKRLHRLYTFTE